MPAGKEIPSLGERELDDAHDVNDVLDESLEEERRRRGEGEKNG